MIKTKKLIPAIAWLFVILILSGYPGNHLPAEPFWQFDKLVHSLMYFILVILLFYGLESRNQQKHNSIKINILVVLFAVFYGGFMEILQHYIFINRSGNFLDFFANNLGVLIGWPAFPFISKYLPKIKQ